MINADAGVMILTRCDRQQGDRLSVTVFIVMRLQRLQVFETVSRRDHRIAIAHNQQRWWVLLQFGITVQQCLIRKGPVSYTHLTLPTIYSV